MSRLWFSSNDSALPSSSDFGILGILNITPDSFYDGGKFLNPDRALSQAAKLAREGAHIIDIGAESTRPGSRPVSPEKELSRIKPVLKLLLKNFPKIPLSIDTRNAITANWALQAGAKIINDVSACDYDPQLIDVLSAYKPAYVLTHAQGNPLIMQANPSYENVVLEIKNFFEKKLGWLVRHGLPENRIILDPGIGFGKTVEHNLEVLRNFGEFTEFGRPLLCAVSMKSFFGTILNHSKNERALDSAMTAACLWKKGAFWFRVHQVEQTRSAISLFKILNC